MSAAMCEQQHTIVGHKLQAIGLYSCDSGISVLN